MWVEANSIVWFYLVFYSDWGQKQNITKCEMIPAIYLNLHNGWHLNWKTEFTLIDGQKFLKQLVENHSMHHWGLMTETWETWQWHTSNLSHCFIYNIFIYLLNDLYKQGFKSACSWTIESWFDVMIFVIVLCKKLTLIKISLLYL